MSGLSYTVQPPTGARWSHVDVECVHHPREALARWSTFDGHSALVWLNSRSREEYLGHVPTPEERDRAASNPVLRGLLSWAIAPAEEGDEGHSRLRLRCGKPSCGVDLKLRTGRVHPAMERLVCALWHNGTDRFVIDDLDGFLRERNI